MEQPKVEIQESDSESEQSYSSSDDIPDSEQSYSSSDDIPDSEQKQQICCRCKKQGHRAKYCYEMTDKDGFQLNYANYECWCERIFFTREEAEIHFHECNLAGGYGSKVTKKYNLLYARTVKSHMLKQLGKEFKEIKLQSLLGASIISIKANIVDFLNNFDGDKLQIRYDFGHFAKLYNDANKTQFHKITLEERKKYMRFVVYYSLKIKQILEKFGYNVKLSVTIEPDYRKQHIFRILNDIKMFETINIKISV